MTAFPCLRGTLQAVATTAAWHCTPRTALALLLCLFSVDALSGEIDLIRHDIDLSLATGAIVTADVDGDGDTDIVSSSNTIRPVPVEHGPPDFNLLGFPEVTWWENRLGEDKPPGDDSDWVKHTIDSTRASTVAAADVDGDGDIDVLGETHWWENTGDSANPWIRHDYDGAAEGVERIVTADVDGDGDPDIVGAQPQDAGGINGLDWLENPRVGGGNWTRHPVDDTAAGVLRVATADVDGDGDPDILAAANNPDEITWWENRVGEVKPPGDDSDWVKHPVETGTALGRAVSAADIDGDGDMDVIGTIDFFTTGDFNWWENTASDGTTWVRHKFDGGFLPTSVVPADFDQDGDTDLVGTLSGSRAVVWWENAVGNGSEWTRHEVTPPEEVGELKDAEVTVASDLNGDGRTDILVAGSFFFDKHILVWWENQRGPHTLEIASGPGGSPASSAGDVSVSVTAADSDGHALNYSWTATCPNLAGNGAFSPDANLRNPTWTAPENTSGTVQECTIEVIVDDGDGGLSATGSYTQIVNTVDLTPIPVFTSKHLLDSGLSSPFAVYAADVDGDGDKDVLGAAADSGVVLWWENPGDAAGVWSRHVIGENYNQVKGLFAADLDGDGDLDVLGSAEGPDSGIRWFENTAGDGSEWTSRTVEDSDGGSSVFAADVDGDGHTDILGVATGVGALSWYENPGDAHGSWIRHRMPEDFSGAFSVHAADIDGDGDIDLLGAAFGNGDSGVGSTELDGDISWWENTNGDGSAFTKHPLSTTLDNARAVYGVDIDGDGDTDVLGALWGSDDIVWWENRLGQGGSWTLHLVDGNFDGAQSVHATDMDGDGDIDVVAVAILGNAVAWWANNAGNGSSWTRHDIDTQFGGAKDVFATDLDGDGDTDIIGAALFIREFAWWENGGSVTPPTPPALVSPAPGSVLPGPSVNFEWSANGQDVSRWQLDIGTGGAGSTDLLRAQRYGANVSMATVARLPTFGGDVFVRLTFTIDGQNQFRDYQFAAAEFALPTITQPTPGATLDGHTVDFVLANNGHDVTRWQLDVGSSEGGADFLRAKRYPAGVTTATVAGLPTVGGVVHVRLTATIEGQRHVQDFQFTAADLPLPALLSPAPGSTLVGHSVDFTWTNNGHDVTLWQLDVGTGSAGSTDLLRAKRYASVVSTATVSRLPTFGGDVFVRLTFTMNGQRQFQDYQFSAADFPPPSVSPFGGLLPGSEAQFTLENNDHNVTLWRVEVFEPSATGRDRRIFLRTFRGTVEEVTVAKLPTFGEHVALRLGYRLGRQPWQYRSFEYEAAAPGTPALVSPLPDGSADQLTLDSSVHPRESVEFTWAANGQPVNRWRLYVGTTRGSRDRFARTLAGKLTSVDTRRLFHASPLYVRLFYRVGRVERFVDYLYHPLNQILRPYYAATKDLGLVAPIRNDGDDRFSASGRLCRGNERPDHEACLPGGLMKVMTLPSSVTACASVTATDLLGLFEWHCRMTGNTAEVISVGLDGPIAQLIDTSSPGAPVFRANQVTVMDGATQVAQSAPEPWWTTPVVTVAPGESLLRGPDTVYVIEQAAHGASVKLDRAPRSVLVPDYAGSAPVTGSGEPGSTLVEVSRSPFAVVTGDYALTGERTALRMDRSNFAQVIRSHLMGDPANDDIDSSPEVGLHLNRSGNVLVDEVTVSHANAIGVYVKGSTRVWVRHSDVVLNGEGVVFDRASGNGLHHSRVAHNSFSGVIIERGSDNHLSHIAVNNNGTAPEKPGEGHGIEVFHSSSRRNHIAFAQVFNNAGHGVVLDGARNTLLEKLTVFNHPHDGLLFDRTDDTTVLSVASLNNAGAGLALIDRSRRTQVRDLVSAHNGVAVKMVGRSIQNTFAGLLAIGGNEVDCEVGPDSRDLAADCSALGDSDHTLITGVDASGSLVGKVATDGPDASGTADHDTDLVNDIDALLDVGNDAGEHLSRGWGGDGGTFPSADHRGPCVSGETCRIWSGAAAAGDTGNGGGAVLADVLSIPGNEDVVQHRFRRVETFLEHASEVAHDGVGNDNGLCESTEECHLDLNIGAWQGTEGDAMPDEEIGFDLMPRSRRDPPAVEDVGLDSRNDLGVGGGV